ncbi:cyclase family protein [Natronorarus salvus]|uniref:cyclase family protein n=1 Tax=Natronorarus salvus TaxID=3117733 RepID=UPI002F2668A0
MTAETVAAQTNGMGELLDDLPNNWGRWGEDDELGALNLLDGEQALRGIDAVTGGDQQSVETFTLQMPMTGEVAFIEEDETPTTTVGDPAFPGRTPARRSNGRDEQAVRDGEQEPYPGGMKTSDDKFVTDFFLHGATHLDALGHAWYGDQIYNGFDAMTTAETKTFERGLEGCPEGEVEEITETRGHARADISTAASSGITGRAVLLDVGRQMGDEDHRLAHCEGITLDDLLTTADEQGVELQERDILLIRTGSIPRVREPGVEWDPANEPGLCYSDELVRWVHDMDVPMLGADNLAVEKVNQEIDGEPFVIPLHGAMLRNLGVYLNEILWLEDLAASCANDGIYEFLFTAAPLHVEMATGAPINPVVMKASQAEA